MPLPNFFVIGAPKAGTTALYQCLSQHPDIYMSPIKEPYYFLFGGKQPTISPGPGGAYFRRNAVWQSASYFNLFADVKDEKAIGEVSPVYLRSPDAARNIHDNIPTAKIVAILRQPADRAYSNYVYMVQKCTEPARSFEEALADEPRRIAEKWFSALWHKEGGLYFKHLSEYFSRFSSPQIHVILYEEWKSDPHKTLHDLFTFLDVNPEYSPILQQSNVTEMPKSRSLHSVLSHLSHSNPDKAKQHSTFLTQPTKSLLKKLDSRFNTMPRPEMDHETRNSLTKEFRGDILSLQKLVNRDLQSWLD